MGNEENSNVLIAKIFFCNKINQILICNWSIRISGNIMKIAVAA